MILKYRCPDCYKVWKQSSFKRDGEVGQCCPACHHKRQTKLREKAAIQIGEPLPPIQSFEYPEPPQVFIDYGITHTRGRRVIRKSEPMGG